MSTLSAELDRYLELRRQMGFKLRRAEELLRQFVTSVYNSGSCAGEALGKFELC